MEPIRFLGFSFEGLTVFILWYKLLYSINSRLFNILFKKAVKVQVGGHSIEIVPDETGRRKEFAVKANELDVDVSNSTVSLPEGRDRFYILR